MSECAGDYAAQSQLDHQMAEEMSGGWQPEVEAADKTIDRIGRQNQIMRRTLERLLWPPQPMAYSSRDGMVRDALEKVRKIDLE